MLQNSVRKWDQNERKWNDCMHCGNKMLDIKRADMLENNITKQKDKIHHVINNLYNDQSGNTSSKNQERRFKYAKKKANDKLENYSDDRFDRILVRHAKTGGPGPLR